MNLHGLSHPSPPFHSFPSSRSGAGTTTRLSRSRTAPPFPLVSYPALFPPCPCRPCTWHPPPARAVPPAPAPCPSRPTSHARTPPPLGTATALAPSRGPVPPSLPYRAGHSEQTPHLSRSAGKEPTSARHDYSPHLPGGLPSSPHHLPFLRNVLGWRVEQCWGFVPHTT